MDVKDFCTEMETELTAWKAKLYDAIRKMDKLGSPEKAKVSPDLQGLHTLVDEITERVESLKTECPSDWSPIKKEIEQKSVDLQKKYDSMEIYFGMIP
jgi:Skp family chaperone for outer membrane proteins